MLMPDPSYPCNRHFVSAADGHAGAAADHGRTSASSSAPTRSQAALEPTHARRAAGLAVQPDRHLDRTRTNWRRIVDVVREQAAASPCVDEIYLGPELRRDASATARWRIGRRASSAINSFSKYFSMTGWRLGWLVLPEALVRAGRAAGAEPLHLRQRRWRSTRRWPASRPRAIAEYERRRAEFRRAPRLLRAGAEALGLPVPVVPDGAFYAWADCSQREQRTSSWDFVLRHDAPRPRRAHARPRLRPPTQRTLHPPFLRQLDGAAAGVGGRLQRELSR